MWIARFAVPAALVLALLFACLAPEGRQTTVLVSAKEVLVLAQRAGGRNYTYSQETAAELERAELVRPAKDASCEALEGALSAAGFALAPIGPADRMVILVEWKRG